VSEAGNLLRRIDQTGVPLLIARLVVGLDLIVYSFVKIRDPTDFMRLIHEYHAFPEDPPIFLNTAAAVLPWFELFAGLALVLGVLLRGASVAVTLMLVVFTIAVAVRALGIYAAKDIAFCAIEFDCGCGVGVVQICKKLLTNGALILLALVCVFSTSRRFCLEGTDSRAEPE
jgi:uncharacterized membrane protein YphA (DoxX/SURF4 family)